MRRAATSAVLALICADTVGAQGIDLSHIPQAVQQECRADIASGQVERIGRCFAALGWSIKASPPSKPKPCRIEKVENVEGPFWKTIDREMDGRKVQIRYYTTFKLTPRANDPLLAEATTRIDFGFLRYEIQKMISDQLPPSSCEATRSSFNWESFKKRALASYGAAIKIDLHSCCKACGVCPTWAEPLRKCDIITDLGSISAKMRINIKPSVVSGNAVQIATEIPPVEANLDVPQWAQDLLHNLHNFVAFTDPRDSFQDAVNDVSVQLKEIGNKVISETVNDPSLRSTFSFVVKTAEFEEDGDVNRPILRVSSQAQAPDVIGCRMLEELRKYNNIQVGR